MGFSRDIFKSAVLCVAAAIATLPARLPWLIHGACARILLVNKSLSALLGSVFPWLGQGQPQVMGCSISLFKGLSLNCRSVVLNVTI